VTIVQRRNRAGGAGKRLAMWEDALFEGHVHCFSLWRLVPVEFRLLSPAPRSTPTALSPAPTRKATIGPSAHPVCL